jgi:hypothetical protein
MQEPSKYDLSDIQNYLATREMGPLALIGPDADIWGSLHNPTLRSPDLVALRPRRVEDSFSNWILSKFMPLFFRLNFHRWRKPDPVLGVVSYRDAKLFHLSYATTSILASMLPVLSIVALYSIRSFSAQLGFIAAFNFLLAVCLAVFTTAKRSDIFVINAA